MHDRVVEFLVRILMVIKVLFSKKIDAMRDAELPLVLTKFFEVDSVPERPTIIQKLKEIGYECHPTSLSVKIHDQDAAMMRSSGILVPGLYKNTSELPQGMLQIFTSSARHRLTPR
jgi:hypothetical protein